jgi:hypothetical protein
VAGGAHAVVGAVGEIAFTATAQEIALAAPVSVTPAFSSYYFSRAPPALL